jgi:beta-glucosidase
LSYTNFSFGHLRLSQSEAKVGEQIEASVDVTNTGSRTGDAVVQLYIHQRAGPVRELKGFRRVSLAVGATQTLHFTLGPKELQFWSPATKTWVVEPEVFDVWVGGDSAATLHSEFRLTK